MSVKDETTRQARMNARDKVAITAALAAASLAVLLAVAAAGVIGIITKDNNLIMLSGLPAAISIATFAILTGETIRRALDYLSPLPTDETPSKEGDKA